MPIQIFMQWFNYRLWQVPYYWVGIKAYDFVSGSECLKSSYYLSKERALELFPMLQRDRLKGAIVYYDGKIQLQKVWLQFVLVCFLFKFRLSPSYFLSIFNAKVKVKWRK